MGDVLVTELAMKITKLDSCAFALEPQDPADRIGALDIGRLRRSGISEAAINIYRRYRSGLVASGGTSVAQRDSSKLNR
jgi:hypothetical protein